jgi:hypothetical protein
MKSNSDSGLGDGAPKFGQRMFQGTIQEPKKYQTTHLEGRWRKGGKGFTRSL